MFHSFSDLLRIQLTRNVIVELHYAGTVCFGRSCSKGRTWLNDRVNRQRPKSPVLFVMPKDWSKTGRKYMEYFESFSALVTRVREHDAAYMYADLKFTADGALIHDDQSFSSLDTTKELPLRITSLSLPFEQYSSLWEVSEYAGIYQLEDNPSLTDSFPTIQRNASFYENCRGAHSKLASMAKYYDNRFYSDRYYRAIINTIWLEAVVAANEAVDRPKSAPIQRNDVIRFTDDISIQGRRAHGNIDMSIFKGHFMLVLQHPKGFTVPISKHIFSTLAQMLAVRDQALRRYCWDYVKRGLTESQIKAVLDEYPSVGVASTGTCWIFIKYELNKDNQRWCVSRSQWYNVPMPTRDTDAERAHLKANVEDMVEKLAGAALMQHHHYVAVEAKLREMSANSEKKEDVA